MTDPNQEPIAELAGGLWAPLPELSKSRRALAERVVRDTYKLAQALLGCMDVLVALHDSLTRAEALEPVLGAARELAGAARLIAFNGNAEDGGMPLHPHKWGGTPKRPTEPLLEDARHLLGEPGGLAARGTELLDQLEELLRHVIESADIQAYVDAHANEAVYLRAATRISRAAPLVAKASRLS